MSKFALTLLLMVCLVGCGGTQVKDGAVTGPSTVDEPAVDPK